MTQQSRQRGQVLVLVAAGIAGFIALMAMIINFGAVAQARLTLDRAATDAATAALQRAYVDLEDVDYALAEEVAKTVLDIELRNVRWQQAGTASHKVSTAANAVTVQASLSVCPPLWACVKLDTTKTARLETSMPGTLAATSVPATAIHISTYTPMPPTPIPTVELPTPTPTEKAERPTPTPTRWALLTPTEPSKATLTPTRRGLPVPTNTPARTPTRPAISTPTRIGVPTPTKPPVSTSTPTRRVILATPTRPSKEEPPTPTSTREGK